MTNQVNTNSKRASSKRISTLVAAMMSTLVFASVTYTGAASAAQITACDTAECVSYFKKFKRAARKGYISAEYNTAKFYYYGYGTEVDKTLALKYYRKSAVNGSKEAQYMTGLIFVSEPGLQDHKQGVYWLERAAANGHIHALFLLGKAHAQGDIQNSGAPNYQASDKWLSRAFDKRYSKLPKLVEELNNQKVFNETNYPSLYNKLVEHNMWLAKTDAGSVDLTNWEGKTYERITVTGSTLKQGFDMLLANFRSRNDSTGSRLGGDCQLKAACQRKSLNEMKDSMWVSQK
ncbi:tetratricopeptide repeat protein [Thalassotalea euphylliae]|uniref:Sel1 repeat family protein n=1 Tax=Thalassotalea euphylliae TaxID=1655234 RepID=A0A3E0TJA0_9GAMM|nr:tetratricopeptide repeat protein [Thalassotalea euphylliae]REL24360.1 sel1 repeat family protein [Thalassotalea euphylliae]